MLVFENSRGKKGLGKEQRRFGSVGANLRFRETVISQGPIQHQQETRRGRI